MKKEEEKSRKPAEFKTFKIVVNVKDIQGLGNVN